MYYWGNHSVGNIDQRSDEEAAHLPIVLLEMTRILYLHNLPYSTATVFSAFSAQCRKLVVRASEDGRAMLLCTVGT